MSEDAVAECLAGRISPEVALARLLLGGAGADAIAGLLAERQVRGALERVLGQTGRGQDPQGAVDVEVLARVRGAGQCEQFAVEVEANGFNINTIGIILMIAGAVGLLMTMLVFGRRDRGAVVGEERVVTRERDVY